MNRPNGRRVLTTIMAAGVLVISGCSSDSAGSVSPATTPAAAAAPVAGTGTSAGSVAVTSDAATGSAAAPAGGGSSASSAAAGSGAVAPGTGAASSAAVSATTAASSTSARTSPAAGSSVAPSGDVGEVTGVAGVTALAKKLGCTAPVVKVTKPGSSAAKAGSTAAATCKANGAEYVLAAVENSAAIPGLVKTFAETVGSGTKVFYVVGPTWFAFGSRTGNDAPEDVAKVIQSKIGGQVKSFG